jgi:serine palmitoyltransferase
MLFGSVANGLNSSGGFCAGSQIVIDHQRINGTSFVFSAAVPAFPAVSASEGINILRNTPSILSTLQENIRVICAVLERVDCITMPSHAVSPIIHIYVRTPSASSSTHLLPIAPAKPSNAASPAGCDAPSSDVVAEERWLQDIVDEALTRACGSHVYDG